MKTEDHSYSLSRTIRNLKSLSSKFCDSCFVDKVNFWDVIVYVFFSVDKCSSDSYVARDDFFISGKVLKRSDSKRSAFILINAHTNALRQGRI